MTHSSSPELKEQVMRAVKEQLDVNIPPETKQTYERLISEGYNETEAHDMLAYVLTAELFTVLKEKRPFDLSHYIANLNLLPALPKQFKTEQQ